MEASSDNVVLHLDEKESLDEKFNHSTMIEHSSPSKHSFDLREAVISSIRTHSCLTLYCKSHFSNSIKE